MIVPNLAFSSKTWLYFVIKCSAFCVLPYIGLIVKVVYLLTEFGVKRSADKKQSFHACLQKINK